MNPHYRACGRIFWGLLLVILDLNINHFDVLIDGIGYVMVATGAAMLQAHSPRFGAAARVNWVLLVLWLVGFAIRGDLVMIYGIVFTVLDCVMMWMLLGGFMEYAAARNRPDLAARAANRRVAYAVLMVLAMLLGWGARNAGRDAVPFVIITLLLMIVLMVMILHLVYRFRHEIAAREA